MPKIISRHFKDNIIYLAISSAIEGLHIMHLTYILYTTKRVYERQLGWLCFVFGSFEQSKIEVQMTPTENLFSRENLFPREKSLTKTLLS